MQPQFAQSGVPPNWHGVMRVSRSADRQAVVCAKMHSSGEAGGARYASSNAAGICSFGKRGRKRLSSATTRVRSSDVRRSSEASPTCGVYRLIQMERTFGLADHVSTNASR